MILPYLDTPFQFFPFPLDIVLRNIHIHTFMLPRSPTLLFELTEHSIPLHNSDTSITSARQEEGKGDRRNFTAVPGNVPRAFQRSSSYGKGGDGFEGQNRGRVGGNGSEGVDRKRGREAELGWGDREGDRGRDRDRDSGVGGASYPARGLGRDEDHDREGAGRGNGQDRPVYSMGGDRDGDRDRDRDREGDRYQPGRSVAGRADRGIYGAIRGRADMRGA